jgi:hypothetical protein
MEYKLSKIPNSYSYKRFCFEKQLDSVQVLILGSSQALYGLNPEFFKLKTFNLSDVSQDLFYDKQLTLTYLDKMPELKYVIINISYFSFGYSIVEGSEAWRMYYYSQYWDIDSPDENIFELKKYSKFFLYTPGTTLSYLLKGFNVDLTANLSNDGFFSSGTGNSIPIICDSIGQQRVRLHDNLYSDKRCVENQKTLDLLVSVIKNKGAEPIFITPPVLPEYYKYVDQQKVIRNHEMINSICKKYACSYYDFFTDSRFSISDFTDTDHLNYAGAEKFSLIVNDLLTSH